MSFKNCGRQYHFFSPFSSALIKAVFCYADGAFKALALTPPRSRRQKKVGTRCHSLHLAKCVPVPVWSAWSHLTSPHQYSCGWISLLLPA